MSRRTHKFWMVLKTKQSHSSDARENCRNQGFEYFHPLFRSSPVRHVRRIMPLFPNYLMVRVDERTQNWKVLASTKGVEYVLMSGDKPGYVDDRVVADLRALTDDSHDGYYHDPKHDPPKFSRGSSVTGLRGLFVGKYGIYRGLASTTRSDRVRVLFNILGREAEYEMSSYDLAAVAA